MLVSLIGGIVVLTFYGIGTRRDNYLSIGGMPDDDSVGRLTVIGSIGRELCAIGMSIWSSSGSTCEASPASRSVIT